MRTAEIAMNKSIKGKMSDKDIVIYALYSLGGWEKRVHTEDIALKCFKLAPSKFSWVKYPIYPDISPTRFALESAKKQKNGSIVEGESERKRTVKQIGGWMLTVAGTKWVKENLERIEEYLDTKKPTGNRLASDRKTKELLKSEAFKKFEMLGDKAEISFAEFAESLLCTVNTRKKILNDRIKQFYSIAENLGKSQIKEYLDFCTITRKLFNLMEDVK